MRSFLPVAVLAAALVATPQPALAQPGTRDVPIRLEERQLRPAGIERGRAEIMLPGQVVVPPQQLRIIAVPAAGMIESLFVSPDERVREGQAVATQQEAIARDAIHGGETGTFDLFRVRQSLIEAESAEAAAGVAAGRARSRLNQALGALL